ncbi:hypothetical protein D3C72_1880260 [compost metagenome]
MPGHADDRALLRLKASAGYKAAQAIGGRALSQKDLSDWIVDWNQFLSASDEGGQSMTIAKAITTVRTITIKSCVRVGAHRWREQRQQKHSRSNRSSQQRNAASHSTVQRDPVVRAYRTANHAPRVSDRQRGSACAETTQREEIQREDIAQEFKTVLQEKVGSATALSLGVFDSK